MLFQLPQAPAPKKVKVAGVVIPIYGYLTVNESIAIDKALLKVDGNTPTTVIQMYRLSAWLSVRLAPDQTLPSKDNAKPFIEEEAFLTELSKDNAKPLIDALWSIYIKEAFPDEVQGLEIEEVLDEVAEGKADKPVIEASSN